MIGSGPPSRIQLFINRFRTRRPVFRATLLSWRHRSNLAPWPHAAKGVTDKDFELAKKIEELVQWQPGKSGGALTGPPAAQPYIKYD